MLSSWHESLAVEPDDIIHLESLSCYLKLIYEHRQQATFSLQLALPPAGDPDQSERIRQRCHHRYMRAVTTIDTELFEHLARQIAAIPLTTPQAASTGQQPEAKPLTGLARQDGGNRGRKTQKPSASQRATSHEDAGTRPHITPPQGEESVNPLTWSETVGPVPDHPGAVDEQPQEEVDPHEYQ